MKGAIYDLRLLLAAFLVVSSVNLALRFTPPGPYRRLLKNVFTSWAKNSLKIDELERTGVWS